MQRGCWDLRVSVRLVLMVHFPRFLARYRISNYLVQNFEIFGNFFMLKSQAPFETSLNIFLPFLSHFLGYLLMIQFKSRPIIHIQSHLPLPLRPLFYVYAEQLLIHRIIGFSFKFLEFGIYFLTYEHLPSILIIRNVQKYLF